MPFPLRRYPIEEAIRYLATSRATLYKDVRAGRVKTITQGKRRWVPGSEIVRLSSVQS